MRVFVRAERGWQRVGRLIRWASVNAVDSLRTKRGRDLWGLRIPVRAMAGVSEKVMAATIRLLGCDEQPPADVTRRSNTLPQNRRTECLRNRIVCNRSRCSLLSCATSQTDSWPPYCAYSVSALLPLTKTLNVSSKGAPCPIIPD